MKILIVSNLFPPGYLGGYELGCSQVAGELSRMGHQVQVLTSDHEDGDEFDYPHADLPVFRLLELYVPFGEPATLMRSRRRAVGRHNFLITNKVIRRFKPDVVYFWSQLRLTVGALRASLQAGIPLAFRWGDAHILGYRAAPFIWKGRGLLRYVLDNWIYPEISLQGIPFRYVSCISHCLKKELIEAGLPIEQSMVNYNGIPLDWFPCKSLPASLHNPLRLLYVGQLHNYKGVHTVIEAAHRLSTPVELTIAGSGPEEYCRELKNLARSGSAKVKFLGKIPYKGLSEVYGAGDIFVFPSIWSEPQGVTYLEAMASGVPVISTTEGGHGEIIRDGYNALTFKKESAEHLAQQITLLSQRKPLRHQLVETARNEVLKRFSLKHFAEQELKNLEAAIYDSKTTLSNENWSARLRK